MENKLFSILRVWKNAFPASILFYFICPLSRLEFDTFFSTIFSYLIEFRNFYRKLRAQNWICVTTQSDH